MPLCFTIFGGRQRAMRELATLNEVSRAIIRADLDVDELCELVYREASKVLDTSWFHLALFDGMHLRTQGASAERPSACRPNAST